VLLQLSYGRSENSVIGERFALFTLDGSSGDRRESKVVIGLVPSVVEDIRRLNLGQGALQRRLVGQADKHHIRYPRDVLRHGRHMKDSMIGLNDLVFEGDVRSDKNKNVTFVDLCHWRILQQADLLSSDFSRRMGCLFRGTPVNC
jgi:hypothetical protein